MRLIPRLLYRHPDIDRLLSGQETLDERLSRLSPYTLILRRAGSRVPPQEEVQRYATQASQLATSAPQRAPSTPLTSSPHTFVSLRPRVAIALLALAVMLFTSAGVALAADYAVPGDTLYTLDRALEDFGIGDGGLPERVAESDHLFQAGRFTEGLTSAAAAIATSDDDYAQQAAAALLTAAEVVSGSGNDHSQELRTQIAESLLSMASTDLMDQEELGGAISALAHGLSAGSSGGQSRDPTTTTTPDRHDPGQGPTSGGSDGEQNEAPPGSSKNGR